MSSNRITSNDVAPDSKHAGDVTRTEFEARGVCRMRGIWAALRDRHDLRHMCVVDQTEMPDAPRLFSTFRFVSHHFACFPEFSQKFLVFLCCGSRHPMFKCCFFSAFTFLFCFIHYTLKKTLMFVLFGTCFSWKCLISIVPCLILFNIVFLKKYNEAYKIRII